MLSQYCDNNVRWVPKDEILMSYPWMAASMASSRRRDYALVLVASVMWGTSFPGSKLTVGVVDPLILTPLRIGIGALSGFLFLAALGRLDLRVFRSPYVWVLGALNAIGFDLQNVGISLTTASKTALLVNVNVVVIAVLMALVFRERMTAPKVLGILIGVLGVIVLATEFNPASLQGGQFAGDVLVFLGGLVWSFYVIGVKEMVDTGGDYVGLTAGILATTALYAAIPVIILGVPFPSGPEGWIGIAYLGLVPTFFPLLLYVASMRTISPTISALLILLEVVVAAILSFAFLADTLSLFTLLGGAFILAGAYVVTRGERVLEPAHGGVPPVPSEGRPVDADDGFR
jgi:drug/metabolite transporter (DMT)-like permease